MIKANTFQELINKANEKQLQKQKRIQADMKLAEDSLNDLYIKVQKNINLGVNPPKYTEIPKLLEKEVQDNLVIEQNYFLDITNNGHVRIYYNKSDFENRKQSLNDIVINNEVRNKAYKDLAKSSLRNKEESKENKNTPITVVGDKELREVADNIEKILKMKNFMNWIDKN